MPAPQPLSSSASAVHRAQGLRGTHTPWPAQTTTDFAGELAGCSDKISVSFLENKRAREAGWQDELPSAQAQGVPTPDSYR